MAVNKLGLLKLARALEKPLPPNFVWDWHAIYEPRDGRKKARGCAIGLAIHMGLERNDINALFRPLGMSRSKVDEIFYENAGGGGKKTIIARRIREYIGTLSPLPRRAAGSPR